MVGVVVAEEEVMVRVREEEVRGTRAIKAGVVTQGALRKQSEELRMAPAVKANRVKAVVVAVVAGMRGTVRQ